MTRHPSVPERGPWILLGAMTVDAGMIAIVGPEMAGLLDEKWSARYVDEDGEPLPRDEQQPPPEHELVEFEEVELTDDGDQAVLVHTGSDGDYGVEGRFTDMDGCLQLTDIRIRLWRCDCGCHGPSEQDAFGCEGDCHDADPDPRATPA